MAPEQTGRMNRSIDARSDLYALGVTLYQMLTGTLPFTASDPMEWVHCHIARKPVPPAERMANVPATVSAIIMKLLAKTAEERYQTSAGVERDLWHCLADWDARGRVDDFPPGAHDVPDRLLIPEQLYGREREIAILLAAYDRVVKGGTPELVLVSGYSGIGKSAMVNELQKALVPTLGLFASGKFDQYKRDIPYSTVAQAFHSLTRHLLGQTDAELAGWRDALRDALGPNGGLMVDLVPELELIIGDQPPVPELPAQQAQRRFQLVFRRFIGVFARPEHPLVLFLDDLQWLDAATLDLLEDLLTRSDLRHLLLIGAYRDNEVDEAHPLVRKRDAMKKAGAKIDEITLAPLSHEHLCRLIADALRCGFERAAPLAQLVHGRTAGNPFFVIQFLYALADEGLLTLDHDAACWSWDLDCIHTKGYTDNVLELMVGKLTRLPSETQAVLQQLACLGNTAEVTVLAIVIGASVEQVRAALWAAVRLELVERLADAYRFLHDRIQEAAYSLIPEALRAEAHLRIGRLLAAHTPAEKREEAIFEIVNQLNRAVPLITSRGEREQLAEMNLLAGRRAKAATAYASALTYLTTGVALLDSNCWERRHKLIFELELNRAECQFLSGALTEAEKRLAVLATHAATTIERAAVACLRVDLYTNLDQLARAVALGIDYLRDLGISSSPHPTDEDVRREYERIWSQLGDRSIEELVDLPLMSDPVHLATLDVLTKLGPPAMVTDPNLASVVICQAVTLSLEQGHGDGSCAAYVRLGMIATSRFGDSEAGYRFGQLGYELVDRRGFERFRARTYLLFGASLVIWTKHVRGSRDLVRRGFEVSHKTGDLTSAGYACYMIVTNLLAAGDPLGEVQREAEQGLAFARKARFGIVIDAIAPQLGLVRTLRGLTPTFGSLDEEEFSELRIEGRFADNPDLARAECWYWIRKLQARFFAGYYSSAIEASSRAQRLLETSLTVFEAVEYHFYSALARAASCGSAPACERQQHLHALAAHYEQLRIWAANCPENFDNRAALVGAEIARIEGRALDAMDLYEQAIRSARASGFVHNEAVANELAARFYTARGIETVSQAYLRNACYCYVRWGADGKVRQLDELYPHLSQREPAPDPRTIGAPVERLDLATVIEVSQALSGEMVLEKLLDTFMRRAIEQAGAERGLLILPEGAGERVVAEATTAGEVVDVRILEQRAARPPVPQSIVHYVVRTRECVMLDDASVANPFSADPYIHQRRARSILCLPLMNQSKLAGVLYLENNLTPRVFTSSRVAVLRLLASQAAISVENTRLYRSLEERESKIRRLVEANIIGIMFWNLGGEITDANDALLQMVGYTREDLTSGRMRWKDLNPPDWRERHREALARLKTTGTIQPYEREYFRKNGSRIPVLVGGAAFDPEGDKGVSFVLDLSERKRAEQALRDSEEQWRAVFEHNPTMYFMIDAAGSVVSVNPFGAEQLGYTVDELIGRSVLDVFHEDDRIEIERNTTVCFEQQGRTLSWEARKVRKDGTIIWVRETARAMTIRQQPILLIVCEDISERKRVEHLTQQWFDSSPNGLAIVGPDYRFRRVNPIFAHYWGISAKCIVGMHAAEFQGVEDFEQVIKPHLDQCFAGKDQEFRYTRWINPAIGRRYVMVTYAPLRPSSGQVEAALIIQNDITEYERAAEALRETQAELAHINRVATMGHLTASIAHEVNQPIAAARNNASAALNFLNRNPPDLEEVREALGSVVNNADRAGEIIGRIRDHIRKAPPRNDRFGLNEAINEVIALAQSDVAKNGVLVQTRLMEKLPFVEGDRVQLQQVVLNLIINAVEAMSSDGDGSRELSISTGRSQTGEVLVAVRDLGPGIDPDNTGRVFESFHTTKSTGMGVGLSICRSIVDAHGGRIWVEANEPRGATFQFTLPTA